MPTNYIYGPSNPVNSGYTFVAGTPTRASSPTEYQTYWGTWYKFWIEYYINPHTDADIAANRTRVNVKFYGQVYDDAIDNIWTGTHQNWQGYYTGSNYNFSKTDVQSVYGTVWYDSETPVGTNGNYSFSDRSYGTLQGDGNGWCIKFADTQFSIPHNSDGTKTTTIQALFTPFQQNTVQNGIASVTLTFDPIPRSSTITVPSGTVYAGTAYNYTVNKAGSNTTEQVLLTAGQYSNYEIKSTSVTTNPFSYTFPKDCVPTNLTGTTFSGTITVNTYSGSTLIGTSTVPITYTIDRNDATYKPTVANPTVVVSNTAVPALGNNIIAGKTQINVQAPANGVTYYGNASMVSRVVSFSNGTTVSANQTDHYSGILPAGTTTWAYTVTDSRNFQTVKTGSVTAITVASPTISAYDAYRGDSSGNRTNDGTYLWAKISATCATIGSPNVNTLSTTVSINGGNRQSIANTGSFVQIASGISPSTTYTVMFYATDLLSESAAQKRLLPKSTPFNIKRGGLGMGIGKVAGTDYLLDVAYDIHTDGNYIYDNTQSTASPGTSATINNSGKGLTIYYVAYCTKNPSNVISDHHGGMVVMFENELLTQHGFTGLSAGMSGNVFQFGFPSNNGNTLCYRIYKNSLGKFNA